MVLRVALITSLLPCVARALSPEEAVRQLEGAGPDVGWQCAVPSFLALDRVPQHELDPALALRRARALLPPELRGARDGAARGILPCQYLLSEVAESEHFIVTWASAGAVSQAAAQSVLDGLEAARLVYLDHGYPEPQGIPQFKIPVYLGNSGPGAPSIGFAGAYTTTCAAYEHAYIVTSFLDETASSIDVMNHELFHAVQFNTGGWYDMDSFWFEGSATWAEDLASPELNLYSWFLSYYTGNPALALDHSGGDELGSLHPYSTFILGMGIQDWSPQGLDVLRHVWVEGSGAVEDRFDTAFAELETGTDFPTEFGRFAAKSTAMDFHDRAIYSTRPAVRETVTDDRRFESVAGPEWYGVHHYALQAPEGRSKARLTLSASDDAWVLTLGRGDGTVVHEAVVKADGEGGAAIEGIDLGTLHSAATASVVRTRRSSGSYDLDVVFVDQDEDPGSDLEPGDDDGGGGRNRRALACAGGEHPFQYGGLSLGLLPLLWRRRRA